MIKLFSYRSIASLILLILFSSLSACGFLNDNPPAPSGETSTGTAQPLTPVPSTPQNNPTPDTTVPDEPSVMTPEVTFNFFEKQNLYANLSDSLKSRIIQYFSNIDLPSTSQTATRSYYNTMFGRATPVLYTRQGALDPDTAIGAGCDPSGPFICLDTPESGFETVQPGIDIEGNIDLNQLAVFSGTDPVIVISVFNNTNGIASIEIPIFPEDVKATDNPDVGRFTAAAGLTGSGRFTIVVSAFRTINEGAGNELYSIMVTGTRLETPQIEFVEAIPDPINKLAAAGEETAAVQNGATIASEYLMLKVRLNTVGGAGIQTRFEDFNDKDKLLSSITALPTQEGGDTLVIGRVPLHQGLNKIRVTSRSPALEALLGSSTPLPSVVEFSVTNVDGGPKIKMLKPRMSGIIPQEDAGDKVEIQFCYSFLPSKGNEGSSDDEECVPGRFGFIPEVYLNAKKIVGEERFSCDDTQGICTARVTPKFGINLYEIRSNDQIGLGGEGRTSSSTYMGSFVYGVPTSLIKNGEITEEGGFTRRGLYLDVDKALVQGEVKEVLRKFLNRSETTELILNLFKKTANTPGYVCRDTDTTIVSNGDTTINFNAETFKLGPDRPTERNPAIQITNISTEDDGLLHLGLVINGMHGEAELRSAESYGNTFNGLDLGFIPINFTISKLEINVGVGFRKNTKGVNQLDIKNIQGIRIVNIEGDGPLGRPVYVDSRRNSLASGIELLDWQRGLLLTQFNNILESTLLCGVEAGLNNENSGALGKAAVDVEKIIGYATPNFLRIPLAFELLGKSIGLDIAYNIFKSDIEIDSDGIHLRNIPLRFNPGPKRLNELKEEYTRGILGSVRRLFRSEDPGSSPQLNPTNATHRLGISLGEDAINQALAAASLAGLIDLDVDANFYTNNELTPALRLTPTGADLASNMDINQDGNRDEVDASTPVLLRVRTNKRVPPMLTFLTPGEVKQLAKEESEQAPVTDGGEKKGEIDPANPAPATPTVATEPFFKEGGRYFRLALSDVYLTAYRQQPVAASAGGVAQYCKVRWQDSPRVAEAGFCSLSAEALIDASKYPALCNGKEMVALPRLAGDVVSQGLSQGGDSDRTIPLYRVKLGLILHGKIAGVDREVSAKERLTNLSAPEKTMLHIQMAPTAAGPSALIQSIAVLENHTGEPDAAVRSVFETIVTGAFGSACQALNEIRVPIPEKFPGDPAAGEPAPEPLLPDFGIESIDIGDYDPTNPTTIQRLPAAFIDDEGLYLDILTYVGLNFTEEGTGSSGN